MDTSPPFIVAPKEPKPHAPTGIQLRKFVSICVGIMHNTWYAFLVCIPLPSVPCSSEFG